MMDFDRDEAFESFENEFQKKKKKKRSSTGLPPWLPILLVFVLVAVFILLRTQSVDNPSLVPTVEETLQLPASTLSAEEGLAGQRETSADEVVAAELVDETGTVPADTPSDSNLSANGQTVAVTADTQQDPDESQQAAGVQQTERKSAADQTKQLTSVAAKEIDPFAALNLYTPTGTITVLEQTPEPAIAAGTEQPAALVAQENDENIFERFFHVIFPAKEKEQALPEPLKETVIVNQTEEVFVVQTQEVIVEVTNSAQVLTAEPQGDQSDNQQSVAPAAVQAEKLDNQQSVVPAAAQAEMSDNQQSVVPAAVQDEEPDDQNIFERFFHVIFPVKEKEPTSLPPVKETVVVVQTEQVFVQSPDQVDVLESTQDISDVLPTTQEVQILAQETQTVDDRNFLERLIDMVFPAAGNDQESEAKVLSPELVAQTQPTALALPTEESPFVSKAGEDVTQVEDGEGDSALLVNDDEPVLLEEDYPLENDAPLWTDGDSDTVDYGSGGDGKENENKRTIILNPVVENSDGERTVSISAADRQKTLKAEIRIATAPAVRGTQVSNHEPTALVTEQRRPTQLPDTGLAQDWNLPMLILGLMVLLVIILSVRVIRANNSK